MASQYWTYLTLKSSFQQQRFRIQDSQKGSLRRKIVLGSKFTSDFYPVTQISMPPSPFLAHYLPSCQDPHLFNWAQLGVTLLLPVSFNHDYSGLAQGPASWNGVKESFVFFGLFLFLRRETLEQFCKLSISVDKQNLTMQKRENICRCKFFGSSAQVGQSLALGRSWDTDFPSEQRKIENMLCSEQEN